MAQRSDPMASSDLALARAVAQVLTGQVLGGPEAVNGGPDSDATPLTAASLAVWLAGQGWDGARIAEHRDQCRAEHQIWPHRLDPVLAEAITGQFARQHELLRGVRALLGLDGLVPTTAHQDGPLTRDEARLVAERPPHHGAVG